MLPNQIIRILMPIAISKKKMSSYNFLARKKVQHSPTRNPLYLYIISNWIWFNNYFLSLSFVSIHLHSFDRTDYVQMRAINESNTGPDWIVISVLMSFFPR